MVRAERQRSSSAASYVAALKECEQAQRRLCLRRAENGQQAGARWRCPELPQCDTQDEVARGPEPVSRRQSESGKTEGARASEASQAMLSASKSPHAPGGASNRDEVIRGAKQQDELHKLLGRGERRRERQGGPGASVGAASCCLEGERMLLAWRTSNGNAARAPVCTTRSATAGAARRARVLPFLVL